MRRGDVKEDGFAAVESGVNNRGGHFAGSHIVEYIFLPSDSHFCVTLRVLKMFAIIIIYEIYDGNGGNYKIK